MTPSFAIRQHCHAQTGLTPFRRPLYQHCAKAIPSTAAELRVAADISISPSLYVSIGSTIIYVRDDVHVSARMRIL